MKKIKKISIGKKIYLTFWAITGIFLITLLVLFVSLKNKSVEKVPNTTGYEITNNSYVPEGIEQPAKNQYSVYTKDLDGDKQINNATTITVDLVDGTEQILTEGEYLSIETVAKIYDFNNYFDLDKYKIDNNLPGTGTDEATLKLWYKTNENNELIDANGNVVANPLTNIDQLQLKIKAIYSMGDFPQELTTKAQAYQDQIAGVGFGFLIAIIGAVMTTVAASIQSKKGGKK